VLTRPLHDERGFSYLELTVAISVFGLFMAAAYAVLLGFTHDVQRTSALASSVRETRPVMRSLVIELRQAVGPSDAVGTPPVSNLAWDRITFYSDRSPIDGDPERYQYVLSSCSGGRCDLDVSVTQPDAGSAPDYTYDGPASTRTVLTDVSASSTQPLFQGRTAAGAAVATCTTATTCSFPLVLVDLHRVTAGSPTSNPLQITEQVRFRNA
jgi:type II secretory pathway pseudopilin PulG